MITLNTEKGLVTIDSWSAIEERPGFTVDVDPESMVLKEIIGAYQFPDPIPCGLKSCHQPHQKGYLVAMNDGTETNIGNVCGRNFFGVDFESLRRTFDRSVRDAEAREKIVAFQHQIPEIKAEVNRIKTQKGGAFWLQRILSSLWASMPEEVSDVLERTRKARSGRLTRTRLATEEERELMDVSGQGSGAGNQYVEEEIGNLSGIEVLFEENQMRELLVKRVLHQLLSIENIDADTTSSKELRETAKAIDDVPKALEQARTAISAGHRFFKRDNLEQLKEFRMSPETRQRFSVFLRSLP